MALRAHKIKDINPVCTFELGDSILWAILEDLSKFESFSEKGGVIEITEGDLEKMENILTEKAQEFDYEEEEAEAVSETIARIKQDLEIEFPFCDCVMYYCY
ncbi:hypothetical protein ACFL6S_12180 [Candidatus Poribacteria bacterium]